MYEQCFICFRSALDTIAAKINYLNKKPQINQICLVCAKQLDIEFETFTKSRIVLFVHVLQSIVDKKPNFENGILEDLKNYEYVNLHNTELTRKGLVAYNRLLDRYKLIC